jgi:hypothetical protein
MKWVRVSREPITTERRTAVEDARGRQGWSDVRWDHGHVRLGAVRDDRGCVLDGEPVFVTEHREAD